MPVENVKTYEKVFVLGLDCATPQLVFDEYFDDLPNFRRVAERGAYGQMRSTIPPITMPAWMCMASSKDPGQLGIYGFRNRRDRTYDNLFIATSLSIKEPLLWNIMGEHDKRSFVFGVPGTYPPRPINGELISGWLAPNIESDYTYPPKLKYEIAEQVGEFMIDVRNFRSDDKERLLKEIYELTDQRFKLARHFAATRQWDLFWMVEMGPDRFHHGFWQYMDKTHHRYVPGNPFENAIRDYYRHVDEQLGLLLDVVDLDTTAFWIVSDHGAKGMTGGVCFNDWLIKEGYLVLKDDLDGPTRFADVNVDWSKTRAWGEGGYYGRCCVNLEGREPNGQVPNDKYDEFRKELIDKLESMVDHEGKVMGTKAYRPEDIYKEVNGIAPDLVVLFGDLDWRSVGTVNTGGIYTFQNDTGPDDANHAMDGIFICSDAGDRHGRGQISIYDVAPSVLSQMGLPVPNDMIGKNILM